MIKPDSLDQLRDIDISSVIGHYVSLKKNGSGYKGCCPFHEEKTPSFNVNVVKGIYKCFGCGAGGDAIRFVMEHEKQSFPDACKTVASIQGYKLEFEERVYSEKEKEKHSAAQLQEEVLNIVVPIYRKQLYDLSPDHLVKQFLHKRGINDDVISEWQLGWAGTEWHFITPQLISQDLYQAAFKLGLIKRSGDDRNYDAYRSRIIIPITDRHGRYIGLGGRFISIDPVDQKKDYPKYINPADCELYNKSNVLFGLNKAVKAIKKEKHVAIVEGYFDVISPHRLEFENVVATCGTAFTSPQMQLIKKHTSHLVLFRDNDNGGATANNSQLPELLKQGFKVDVFKYDKKDPDEWVQSLDTYNNAGGWTMPIIEDALITRGHQLWRTVEELHQRAEAKRIILELLCCISNDILRNNYLDHFCKAFGWKAVNTKKELAGILETTADEDEEEIMATQLPSWLTQEEKDQHLMNGYVSVNKKVKGRPVVGYYSFQIGGGKTEITNFIITPLFHVYASVESRFLIQIDNGLRRSVLDIPARSIPSIDQFQAYIVAEGNYIIFGAKNNWLRIASDILRQFPRCTELRHLGWQSYNFFAFVDKVYLPGEGTKDLDNWGIIRHNDDNYLIPASCEAYRQLRHTGEDPFENDRHLSYKQSPVTFEAWAKQMQRVYKQPGIVGIAAVIMSLFRDLVFDVDNNCPHFYAFGEPSSGKSKWAESITAAFFHKRPAFNLNSGTDFAFFSYMQRYINCPAHLNEFEIEVIRPEWFEAIKGIFDGEGREKGRPNGGSGGRIRTEIMKVKSVLVLTGQKLITANDNSVVSRSIIEGFNIREDLSEEDKQAYTELKSWESVGLSSMLLELLKYREEMEAKYKECVNDQLSIWRREKKDARALNQRILQNYAHLAVCYELISYKISLPQSAKEFKDYCFSQARRWSMFIRNSDSLSEFWRTLEFMISQQQVSEGWDYTIEEVREVRIRLNREDEESRIFEHPVKIMFLRLNQVHKLYQIAYRQRTGKEAMSIENMLHYFSSRKYFVGSVKMRKFRRFVNKTENRPVNGGMLSPQTFQATTGKVQQEQRSSCYAFLYDELNIEIELLEESGEDSAT